jgi:hypothetical protein
MAKETTIDAETARRLLLILSLEGDVKREEIEWALAIIHQIPGYGGMTLAKAVQDRSLKEILVAIAAEQISPTTPKDLEALIEDAKKRKATLETAKKAGEKRAEEFIEAAEKAAKTKAQVEAPPAVPEAPTEEPASIGIKITPAALKAFEESAGKAAGVPFKLVSFFSPPGALAQTPQTTAALASAMSLSQISAKAEGLPDVERKHLLQLVENFRQAEFSFYAQVQLQRKRTGISVQEMIILMGPEFGRSQGEVVALARGGAPSGRGPSFIGRIGQQIFGGLTQKAVTNAATKAVASALTKTGISVTTKAVAGVAGAPGGPIGIAIGLAVGWVVDKVLGPLINKVIDFISQNKWVLAAPFVLAGLIFGLPWLTVGGIALGGLLLAGGVGPALSMAGGFALSVISGITSLAVASIATPLIVALISIPVLVAIILFIINSSAYLVPPKAPVFTGILESPYIAVEKKASPECLNRPDPEGKPCPPLPGEVTYEIEIKAKRGTLSNIKIQNSYQVFGRGSGDITPPEIPVPNLISPTAPFTFSYTLDFGRDLNDSVVYDTLTVTADSPEQAGAVASDVASVIIGNPPASSCPILGGSITTGSYNGTREVGHGSNSYWGGPAGNSCYDIPAFSGCRSPSSSVDPDGNNYCRGKASSCAYYGFAADVQRSGRGDIVQLPSIFGKSITWTFQRRVTINDTAWGWGYVFTGSDGGSNYSLYLGHLNQTTPPQTAPSGTVVGTLYPNLTPPHVHIELQINGQWVRPDFLCGGPGP